MNLKVGDKVIVIAGSNKGKEGTIKKVLRQENRVIIEGVNLVKKHQKGNGQESGGILEIGKKIEKDKKVRIAIKSSEKLD